MLNGAPTHQLPKSKTKNKTKKIPFSIFSGGWKYPLKLHYRGESTLQSREKWGDPATKPSALTGMWRQILRTLMNQGDHKARTPGLCCHADATLDQVRQARHQLHQHRLVHVLHALPDKPSQSPQWVYSFSRTCTLERQKQAHTARQTITITSVITVLLMYTWKTKRSAHCQTNHHNHLSDYVHLEDKNEHKTDFTNWSDAGGLCVKNFTQGTPRILLPQFWLFFKRNGLPQSGHLSKGMAFHHPDIFQKERPSTVWSSFKRNGLPPSGHLSKGLFTIWSSFKREGKIWVCELFGEGTLLMMTTPKHY